MKNSTRTCLAVAVAAGMMEASTTAQPLHVGHVDIGVAYEDGEWDLHIHDEETDTEYSPQQKLLQVGSSAQAVVPTQAGFSFLGAAGASVWILPQVENSSLLFLGLGAEEIEDGVFAGNRIQLGLKSVRGPGDFFVYSTGSLGQPERLLGAQGDLVDPAYASAALTAGSHQHVNWAFTAPGIYWITFQASGELVSGGESISPEAYYTFEVVPEPGTLALAALGLVGLISLRRCRA